MGSRRHSMMMGKSHIEAGNNRQFQTTNLLNSTVNVTGGSQVAIIDNEIECDFVYNDYLQANLKQLILKKLIKEHTEIFKEQIVIQTDFLFKMKESNESLQREIIDLQNQYEIGNILNNLQSNINGLSEVCVSLENPLLKLIQLMKNEKSKVKLVNIDSLKDQAEYDKFIEILSSCNDIMDKILNSGRDFESVKCFADAIKKHKDLTKKIQCIINITKNIQKELTHDLFKNLSDIFAANYNSNK